jgi:hypothetical protein
MAYRLHYFSKPSDPSAVPYCFSNPTTEWATTEEARNRGQQDSMLPKMQAHSFAVEDVSTGEFVERWTRDDGNWRQVDA